MLIRPILAVAIALAPVSLPAAPLTAAFAQGKGCPPGLAKKNPPCVPPGQAKKRGYSDRDDSYRGDRDGDWVYRGDRIIGPDGRVYRVGDRLPGGYIVLERDDWDRYGRLPRLPDGHRYVRIDNEIVEVIEATNTIVRFFDLLGN
ncbi:RcnB family protein [Halovulum sp. GXIMD14794]